MALIVKGLSKKYEAQLAVDDLSFTIEKGSVVGFLGPNGAGKSTTLKMIAGFLAPDAGEVILNGISNQKDSIAFKMLSNKHNLKKESLDHFNNVDFEILKLICQQKNANEIAQEMKMSVNTINKYRSKLMEKTNSQNLAGMVIFAIQNGIYVIPNKTPDVI